jgi:threonine/homoserine/homoserine lactone efflux protein
MLGIDVGAFCAAVVLFLALPGPGTFTLLSSTAQGGFRGGAAATLGLILGDQVLLWLAAAGVAALLAANPLVFKALQIAGATYLGWLGLKMLLARDSAGSLAVRVAAGHYLRQSFLITLANPKAIVFYMAFFPLFIDPAKQQGVWTYGVMALLIAMITAVWCLALCAGAQVVSAFVRAHRRLALVFQRLAGLAMLGFGLRLVR